MADRVQVFHHLIPGITLTDLVLDLDFTDGIVEHMDILFPDGCLGNVSAKILYGGTQVIPSGNATIKANDETVPFPLSGLFPTGGSWQLAATNVDWFEHELEVRVYIREIPAPVPGVGLPVPVE